MKRSVKARQGANARSNEYKDYFWGEWIDGRFNKLQIWNCPCPGVTTTNSCVESLKKISKISLHRYAFSSRFIVC